RRRHSAQLRFEYLRREAFVDAPAFYRRDRDSDKTAGRQRARDLRAVRRSGFFRRGGTGGQGHARCIWEIATYVRHRQQWRVAQERVRKSSEKSARQPWTAS